MSHNIVITIPSISFDEAILLLEYYNFCELRIDLIDWSLSEIKSFISQTQKILVTYHPVVSDDQRLDVLRQLKWDQIDFFDLELDCEDDYAKSCKEYLAKSSTKIIRSYHNYDSFELPQDIMSRFTINPDVILKIAVLVRSSEDLETLFSSYELRPNMILIGMGDEGIDSRFKADELGAPFMYCYPDTYMPVAPGQLSFSELNSYHRRIVTEYSFVAGRPIIYSKSPQIFNYFFDLNGINGKYLRLIIDSLEELSIVKDQLPIKLINVTSPFKYQTASIKVDGSTPINSVSHKDQWEAKNTDANAVELLNITSGSKVLIVGSGGSAEAALIGLKNKNISDSTLCSRNKTKAKILCEKYSLQLIHWDNLRRKFSEFDIVIWTIPSQVFIDKGLSFNKEQQVLEVNYKKSLRDLKILGNVGSYFSGSDWLIAQAIPNLQSHFSIQDLDHLKFTEALAVDHLSQAKKVCLVGLPCSGKTSVGDRLASELERKFIDLDVVIENEYEKSIPQIFEEDGENAFRKLERNALKNALSSEEFILSTGGGVIEDLRNRIDIQDNCFTIFLLMKPETALDRNNSNRPLLKNNTLEKLIALHEHRLGLYLDIADAVIDVNSRTVDQVAERIYEELCSIK